MTVKVETIKVEDNSTDLGREIQIEFNNLQNPGVMLEFTYGDTKNFKKYKLFDGVIVKLPEKVVRHLETCGTPFYKYAPDCAGVIVKTFIKMNPRFSCRRVY